MKEMGIQPDAVFYNMAISTAGESGRWADGLALLEEMHSPEAEGVKPDGISYSTAILLCGRCGQLQEGLGKRAVKREREEKSLCSSMG